jgi:antitoxin component of MazEF toxin-antitoxin module
VHARNRPAVYLPDDVVKAVKVEIGDDVEIYVEGNRIIIEPIGSE